MHAAASPSRAFAKHVHAEAHAVIALRQVRRALDAGADRAALYRLIEDETIKRCQRCGLEPDLIGDALEAAEDDMAIAALDADVHCFGCDKTYSAAASGCPDCAADAAQGESA